MGSMKSLFLSLFFYTALFSDFQMQHSIFFVVEPLNQIGQIIGPSPSFTFTGKGPCPCVENTYSIATNGINKKICGFLDQNMPSGTHLWVNLSPPSGARSMGNQELSATPVDLVIELSQVSEAELPMTYSFTATPEAGVISGATRVVFYTLTDG